MAVNKITLDAARKMIDACYEKAKGMNIKVAISVTDEHGDLVAFNKMEGSLLVSAELSMNKAWTATALRIPTADFQKYIQPGAPLYGIELSHNQRFVSLAGGLPLKAEGAVVGGIGVSGGSSKDDTEIAQSAVDLFNSVS